MRLLFALAFLFSAGYYCSCNNNTEDPDVIGSGGQSQHQYIPNFDSTYKLCLGRDTLNVRITDTLEGYVYYITLPDSIASSASKTEFINLVEACFPE